MSSPTCPRAALRRMLLVLCGCLLGASTAIPRRVTRKALLAPLFPDDPPRRKRT